MLKYLLIGVSVFCVMILLWVIKTYNNFIRLNNDCEEGFSTMDVCMKKRFDLIPNLVETVKGYAKHEKETLQSVVEARAAVSSASSDEERMVAENQLTGTLRTLFAVAEAYPDLKANENFLDLQKQLSDIESEIANSRRYYNAVVKTYNNAIQMFPASFIANMFGYGKRLMYEVNTEEEREAVQVKF